jgi:hypothetical protein
MWTVGVVEPDVLLGFCCGEAESFVAGLAGVVLELVDPFDGVPELLGPGLGDAVSAVRGTGFDDGLPRPRCTPGRCHCARKPSSSPSRSSGLGSTSVAEGVDSSSPHTWRGGVLGSIEWRIPMNPAQRGRNLPVALPSVSTVRRTRVPPSWPCTSARMTAPGMACGAMRPG